MVSSTLTCTNPSPGWHPRCEFLVEGINASSSDLQLSKTLVFKYNVFGFITTQQVDHHVS